MKKILIIKTSALGDIMIALPHIEAVAAHHRGDQIWLMTGPHYVDIFSNHPALQVAVLDRSKKIAPNSTWQRITWVRKQKFDCIYDLQGNRTSRLIIRLSGAAKKVGTQPRPIYTHHPAEEYTGTSGQNVFDRLNETLQAGGLPPASPGCPLYLSETERQDVLNWKKSAELVDGTYVLFHAGGSTKWLSKRWPEENYGRLAELVETLGLMSVWVGGPDERELNARLAARCGIDATGKFSPLQLCFFGQRAAFAVTNDSGPMHILSTAGIPVYSFFGPTDWRRSHGAGQAGRVLKRELECSPCFKGMCPPARNHACLDTIAPEEVFNLILREFHVKHSSGNDIGVP